MSISQAVILCGGPGTRLNDQVRFQPAIETPKPLMEVGGKPFVTYAINMLKGIGVSDIVLLVGHLEEEFDFLDEIKGVRLVTTQENVNRAVLAIPKLQATFVLLNGDCFPIMDWRAFVDRENPVNLPKVAVKIVDRDAGIAIVAKEDILSNRINCADILGMLEIYKAYTILGGLHIGTYQGLERARQFMDLVVFGQ